MAKEIVVFRSGGAVWLEIDGHPLPVDWVDSASVHLDVDEDHDIVAVTFRAERVHVESHPTPRPEDAFHEEDSDGETQEGTTQEATGEQLRVSGST